MKLLVRVLPKGSWAHLDGIGSCGQGKRVPCITGPNLPLDHTLFPEEGRTLAQSQSPEVCRDSKSCVKPESFHTSPQVTNSWEWKEKDP